VCAAAGRGSDGSEDIEVLLRLRRDR
jgi:hypothetical protein